MQGYIIHGDLIYSKDLSGEGSCGTEMSKMFRKINKCHTLIQNSHRHKWWQDDLPLVNLKQH